MGEGYCRGLEEVLPWLLPPLKLLLRQDSCRIDRIEGCLCAVLDRIVENSAHCQLISVFHCSCRAD